MRNIFLTLSVILYFLQPNYAQQMPNPGPEQEIRRLSMDWMKAAMNRDQQTLDKIVAPEFKLTGTDLTLPVLPRDIWMKNTMEKLKIDSIQYIEMRVDIIKNTAIVQSSFYWSVSFQEMPAKKDTVKLIDIWIRRKNDWQVVSRVVAD